MLFVFFMGLTGCATFTDAFRPVEMKLASGEYEEALKLLEKSKGPERDRVLYLMNRGMVLRMMGEFAQSNAEFEQAKAISQQLQAVSVTETAGSVSINETMRSYAGEGYEIILLHLFMALNYLELGQIDSARVEALQIDVKLKEMAGTPFEQDPLSRYLMGVIFEALREYDDALIAYRHAYEAYQKVGSDYKTPLPDLLKRDLLRLTRRQGFPDEHERYKEQFKLENWVTSKEMAQGGELIVFIGNNLAPLKREHIIAAQSPKGQILSISTPYYESRPLYVASVIVRADATAADGEMVENVDAIARATLERQMPAIVARAIARAVIKKKAADKAGEQNGLLGNYSNLFTQRFLGNRTNINSINFNGTM